MIIDFLSFLAQEGHRRPLTLVYCCDKVLNDDIVTCGADSRLYRAPLSEMGERGKGEVGFGIFSLLVPWRLWRAFSSVTPTLNLPHEKLVITEGYTLRIQKAYDAMCSPSHALFEIPHGCVQPTGNFFDSSSHMTGFPFTHRVERKKKR